jgi:hypothetical protein
MMSAALGNGIDDRGEVAGSSDAPPMSPPSTSGSASSSAALPGFMLPPYWTRTLSPCSRERSPTSARQNAHASCACSVVATLPRADRPDRLVGDDDLVQPRGRALRCSASWTCDAQLALGVAALALLLGQPTQRIGREALLQRDSATLCSSARSVSP